jgi:hypothetical protein
MLSPKLDGNLAREDLDKVCLSLRDMVQKAWDNGEEVPEGVTLICEPRPLTPRRGRLCKRSI